MEYPSSYTFFRKKRGKKKRPFYDAFLEKRVAKK